MNANARIERTLPSQASQLDANLALFAELIGLLQMHRGASLAALGGADSFVFQALGLHPQVDTVLAKLAPAAGEADAGLWAQIDSEWRNTCRHWRHDSALGNFEIHNYLIEQCHRLLWQFAAARAQARGKAADNFLFRDLPLHVESLAQLRGLSAFALTRQAQSDAAGYLPRLQQLARQCHLSLVDTQRQLIAQSDGALMPALQQRIRVTGQFLQSVQHHVLAKAPLAAKPERLFQLGSLAIEANQKVWIALAV